jgi:putative transferase (TIGR04331 family)
MFKIKINSFFPSENFSEVCISQKDTKKLSKLIIKFHKKNIGIFRDFYNKQFKFKYNEILINRAISPINYIFFERFDRAYKFHQIKKGNYETGQSFYEFEQIHDMEAFAERSSFSKDFNLNLIINFLKIIKQDSKWEKKTTLCKNNYKFNSKIFKNFHINFYKVPSKIIIKINYYLEKIFNKLYFYKKIPLMNSSTSHLPFRFYGFYIRYFSLIKSFELIKKNSFSNILRDKLIEDLKKNKLGIEIFLKKYNLNKDVKTAIINYYYEFLKINYPMCFLENLENNFYHQEKILKKFRIKKIFASDHDSTSSSITYFVAKNLNYELFKFQHGGHYGYLEDTLAQDQIEIKNSDFFISNGWKTKIKKYNEKTFVNFVKLPSPLFSEKKKIFKIKNFNRFKKFDFIFLPQGIRPFTLEIQGAANFRRDIIFDYIKQFWELSDKFKKNNLNFTIKFYNLISKNFINKNLSKLKKKFKNTIHYENNFNKGLTQNLLDQGNIILFDQPGTAFIECLNCKIPTMVYWKKIFNEPSKRSQKIFNNLKKVDIIHDNALSLIKAYKNFKKNPYQWINCKKRNLVIKEFCDTYALTDHNWSKIWKNFLIKKL